MESSNEPLISLSPLIYVFDTRTEWNSDEEFQRVLRILPNRDQETVNRYKFRIDAKMALASGLLKRYAIAQFGKDPNDWQSIEILKTDRGRPYINVNRFDFNISHHSGVVVIALRFDEQPIGVDLTFRSLPISWPRDSWLDPFLGLLSRQEMMFLNSFNNDLTLKSQAFFHIWALKEAYIKCTGEGIKADLSKVDFTGIKIIREDYKSPSISSPPALVDCPDMKLFVNTQRKNYHISMFLVDHDILGAVVTPNLGTAVIQIYNLSLSDLTRGLSSQ